MSRSRPAAFASSKNRIPCGKMHRGDTNTTSNEQTIQIENFHRLVICHDAIPFHSNGNGASSLYSVCDSIWMWCDCAFARLCIAYITNHPVTVQPTYDRLTIENILFSFRCSVSNRMTFHGIWEIGFSMQVISACGSLSVSVRVRDRKSSATGRNKLNKL